MTIFFCSAQGNAFLSLGWFTCVLDKCKNKEKTTNECMKSNVSKKRENRKTNIAKISSN